MNNEFPHFLDDLRKKRDCLNEVIARLEQNFSIPDGAGPTFAPLHPNGKGTARRPRPASAGRKGKRASKRNERTNERTNEQKPRRRRSLPSSAEPP